MKKILIIGFVWPEPNATAAGSRMFQLIQFFIAQQYHVTFASTATETAHTLDLTNLGVNKKMIELNSPTFDVFVDELKPDIVLFDRFMIEEQFGWRVAKQLPNTIRILDSEDLHSLRAARYDAYKANTQFSNDDWLIADITKREIASIYRCDFTLIISSYENQLLKKQLQINDSLLLHLPFMLNKIKKTTSNHWLSFHEKENFISIGNGKHAPNIDAIHWLKKEIWPLIRKQLPKARLDVYGAYLPQGIEQMHQPKEGFYIKGRAEDAIQTIGKARINLAPLRFGAGIKGKLIDGMLAGTPSVTTSIGAEGMHDSLPWNGNIATTGTTFANLAVELYQNETKWQQAQHNGRSIINTLYDKNILTKKLKSKIETIQKDIETHRNKNFIGAMLMHHTMKSTKYLSRWIEAKNMHSSKSTE